MALRPELMTPVAKPIQGPIQIGANQTPLNPMLLLQGLAGLQTAGQPGTTPAVAQGLGTVAPNPLTAALLQRLGKG